MPSVLTIDGNRACRFQLTRVFRGERETKGCFPTRQAALHFADALNPIPCRGKKCWTPIVSRPPGVPRSVLGSSASEHRWSAKAYEDAFDRAIRDTRSNTSEGMCTRSLQQLMEAAQMRQGYAVHANAFKKGQKDRKRVLRNLDNQLQFAMHAFARKCLF